MAGLGADVRGADVLRLRSLLVGDVPQPRPPGVSLGEIPVGGLLAERPIAPVGFG